MGSCCDRNPASETTESITLACRACVKAWLAHQVNQRLYMGRACGHNEAGTTRQADPLTTWRTQA